MKRDAKGHLLPKITDTPMKPILDSLNNALRKIRELHPEVPNAVLVIGTSSITKYGHFAPKSWDSKQANNEIMLSGEGLHRGAEATLGTLIHECAHALASVREIKDTSRQGRWHNVQFKNVAEELGIEVDKDKSIGWSITSVPKGTLALYKVELAEIKKALKAWRKTDVKVKPPKTTVRIECECEGKTKNRGLTVPISFYEGAGITCDECGQQLQSEEDKQMDSLKEDERQHGWDDENDDENEE